MNWHELLLTYWPMARWAADPDIAQKEIKAFYDRNPPSSDELIAVVRWLSKSQRRGDKSPGLQEFIWAIGGYRKEQREEDFGHTELNCRYCRNAGFVTLYEDLPVDCTWEQQHLDGARSIGVPCLCAAGRRVTSKGDYAKASEFWRSHLEGMARKAQQQFDAAARHRADEEQEPGFQESLANLVKKVCGKYYVADKIKTRADIVEGFVPDTENVPF